MERRPQGQPENTILFEGAVFEMAWVYWGRLYNTKFQASCLAKRMEEDWWIYGYESPQTVEIFCSKKGRYGVRYML